MGRSAETFRVQIRLPQASIERLERLAEKTEAGSLAEVTRSALRLYEAIIEGQASGARFMMEKDGETTPILVMI